MCVCVVCVSVCVYVCVRVCVFVSVCYQLISEAIKFSYPDKLSMDKTGCETSEFKKLLL